MLQQAGDFVQEAQKDGLKCLLQEASCHFADSTLSLMVVGLNKYLESKEKSEFEEVSFRRA